MIDGRSVYNASDYTCDQYRPAKPLTNADRIRQMTDEELAEWLDHVAGCGVCVLDEGKYRYSGDHCTHEYECIQYIEKWLKQEVSEDAESDTEEP
jgi:hypothetical protein